MLTVNGYFDGNVCVPLDFDKNAVPENTKVIITFLDEKKEEEKTDSEPTYRDSRLNDFFKLSDTMPYERRI